MHQRRITRQAQGREVSLHMAKRRLCKIVKDTGMKSLRAREQASNKAIRGGLSQYMVSNEVD